MSKRTHNGEPKTPSSIWEWIIIIGGAMLFASLTLLPFLVRSYASIGTVLAGPGTVLQGCIRAPSVTSLSECPIGNPPQSSQVIGIAGIVTFMALGVIVLKYAHRYTSYVALKKFVIMNIVVAVLAISACSTAYIVIRNSNQNNALQDNLTAMQQQRYELGLRAYAACVGSSHGPAAYEAAACTQANTLLGGTITQQSPSHTPGARVPLGYGILPEYVIILGTLYVVAPLLNWYRLMLSPGRIRGQRKETLFQ